MWFHKLHPPLITSLQVSLDHLQDLNDKIHKRVEKLEFVCAKQERDHIGRVRELEPMFHVSRMSHD